MMFESMKMPRAWIIYRKDTKEVVWSGETEAGATAERERLELLAWRESKPESLEALSFDDIGDPWESLRGILDRMHGDQELWAKAA